MKKCIATVVAVIGLLMAAWAQSSKPLYENDFEKSEAGKVPDDFLVLDGQFGVKEEEGNKVLELPGAPLDTYGVLFGPTEKEGTVVFARIFGSGKGRRFPAFAASLNGVGGYKLQISPAKKLVELYKGETVKVTVPYEWVSGKWTHLKLQVRKVKDGQWKVEGKAWQEGNEPSAWTISFDEKEEPIAGRAAVWGNPFSGTPIRFDDFKVARVAAGE
ncbi:MAG TPA: hypothetical protein VJW76_11570 [Verrucomicrobiae bacterium]|nr:hypothetical protein [Verrucomicrobiae bacterium]